MSKKQNNLENLSSDELLSMARGIPTRKNKVPVCGRLLSYLMEYLVLELLYHSVAQLAFAARPETAGRYYTWGQCKGPN